MWGSSNWPWLPTHSITVLLRPQVAFFWSPGWHVYAVAVWILGPLSRAAARKIGGLQTIPYQIHIGSGAGDDLTPVRRRPRESLCNSDKTVWISLFLKLADLKLRKVLQLSDSQVRILHLPWRRWALPWLGIQSTSEDSLVWISLCRPSRGCRGGWGDWGHA